MGFVNNHVNKIFDRERYIYQFAENHEFHLRRLWEVLSTDKVRGNTETHRNFLYLNVYFIIFMSTLGK